MKFFSGIFNKDSRPSGGDEVTAFDAGEDVVDEHHHATTSTLRSSHAGQVESAISASAPADSASPTPPSAADGLHSANLTRGLTPFTLTNVTSTQENATGTADTLEDVEEDLDMPVLENNDSRGKSTNSSSVWMHADVSATPVHEEIPLRKLSNQAGGSALPGDDFIGVSPSAPGGRFQGHASATNSSIAQSTISSADGKPGEHIPDDQSNSAASPKQNGAKFKFRKAKLVAKIQSLAVSTAPVGRRKRRSSVWDGGPMTVQKTLERHGLGDSTVESSVGRFLGDETRNSSSLQALTASEASTNTGGEHSNLRKSSLEVIDLRYLLGILAEQFAETANSVPPWVVWNCFMTIVIFLSLIWIPLGICYSTTNNLFAMLVIGNVVLDVCRVCDVCFWFTWWSRWDKAGSNGAEDVPGGHFAIFRSRFNMAILLLSATPSSMVYMFPYCRQEPAFHTDNGLSLGHKCHYASMTHLAALLLLPLRMRSFERPLRQLSDVAPAIHTVIKIFVYIFVSMSYISGLFMVFGANDLLSTSNLDIFEEIAAAGNSATFSYLRSLSWSMSTFADAAAGSRPTSVSEAVFLLFIMVLSQAVIGTVLATGGEILFQLDSTRSKFSKDAKKHIDFVRRSQPQVQEAVAVYSREWWERFQGHDEGTILDELKEESFVLHMELVCSQYRPLLEKTELLKDCEPGFLDHLAGIVQPTIAVAGDLVVEAGQAGLSMYFITKGSVNILILDKIEESESHQGLDDNLSMQSWTNGSKSIRGASSVLSGPSRGVRIAQRKVKLQTAQDRGPAMMELKDMSDPNKLKVYKKVATLKAGQVFGEIAVALETARGTRTATVQAAEDVEFLVAERSKFRQLLSMFPSSKAHFMAAAEAKLNRTSSMNNKATASAESDKLNSKNGSSPESNGKQSDEKIKETNFDDIPGIVRVDTEGDVFKVNSEPEVVTQTGPSLGSPGMPIKSSPEKVGRLSSRLGSSTRHSGSRSMLGTKLTSNNMIIKETDRAAGVEIEANAMRFNELFLLANSTVLNPNHSIVVVLRQISLLASLIQLLVVPAMILSGSNQDIIAAVQITASVFMLLGFLLSLVTARRIDKAVEEPILDIPSIVKFYMARTAVFDFIGALPWFALLIWNQNATVEAYRVAIWLPGLQIVSFLLNIKHSLLAQKVEHFFISKYGSSGIRLARVLLSVLLLSAFFGNLWIGTATRFEINGNFDSYTESAFHPNLNGMEFPVARSFAWGIISLSSASSDIFANSSEASIITIFSFLFGIGCVSFLIGSANTIMATAFAASTELVAQLEDFNDFAVRKNLPSELLARTKRYFMYKAQSTVKADQSMRLSLRRKLPETIFGSVLDSVFGDAIKMFPMFQDAPQSFIRLLVTLVEPEIVMEKTVIMREGDVGNCMYFIVSGECGVTFSGQVFSSKRKAIVLQKGQFFGEIALVPGISRRTATISALTDCELFKLSKPGFQSLMEVFPESAEKIVATAAKRVQHAVGQRATAIAADLRQGTEKNPLAIAEEEHEEDGVRELTRKPSLFQSSDDPILSPTGSDKVTGDTSTKMSSGLEQKRHDVQRVSRIVINSFLERASSAKNSLRFSEVLNIDGEIALAQSSLLSPNCESGPSNARQSKQADLMSSAEDMPANSDNDAVNINTSNVPDMPSPEALKVGDVATSRASNIVRKVRLPPSLNVQNSMAKLRETVHKAKAKSKGANILNRMLHTIKGKRNELGNNQASTGEFSRSSANSVSVTSRLGLLAKVGRQGSMMNLANVFAAAEQEAKGSQARLVINVLHGLFFKWDSEFLMLWELFVIFMTWSCALATFVAAAFPKLIGLSERQRGDEYAASEQVVSNSNWLMSMHSACTAMYIWDIVVAVLKERMSPDGTISRDYKEHWKLYRKQAVLDAIASVPWHLVMQNPLTPLLSLRLLRFLDESRWDQLAAALTFYLGPMRIAQFRLLTFVLIFYSIGHIFACCWIIGLSDKGTSSFAIEQELDNVSFGHQYIRSLAWSVTSLVDVGAALVPSGSSGYENGLVISVVVVGLFISAVIVGSVNNALEFAQRSRATFERQKRMVVEYLVIRQAPKFLISNVSAYFDTVGSRQKTINESKVLEGMPESLTSDIQESLYMPVMARVPLFQDPSLKAFCQSACDLATVVLFLPGDVIITNQDSMNDLYIVESGSVEMRSVAQSKSLVLRLFNVGAMFGLNTLGIQAELVAVETTRVLRIQHMHCRELFTVYGEAQEAVKQFFQAEQSSMQAIMPFTIISSLATDCAANILLTAAKQRKRAMRISPSWSNAGALVRRTMRSIFVMPTNSDPDFMHHQIQHILWTQLGGKSMKRWFFIHPRSIGARWSAIFTGVVLLLSVFLAPMSFSVLYQENGYSCTTDETSFFHSCAYLAIDWILECAYILSMLFQLFESFFDRNLSLQIDTAEIRKRYIKGWFLLDVFSIFPMQFLFSLDIEFEFNDQDIYISRLIQLIQRSLRIGKLSHVMRKMEDLDMLGFLGSVATKTSYRLSRLLIYVLLTGHYIGCLWKVLYEFDMFSSPTFVLPSGFEGLPFAEKIVFMEFMGFASFFGLGAELKPLTIFECIFTIFVSFVGMFVNVIVIGSIHTEISNANAVASDFRERVRVILDLMKYRRMKASAVARMEAYFNTRWQSDKGLEPWPVIQEMPRHLRGEIYAYLFLEDIQRVSLFCKADMGFQRALCQIVRPIIVLPGETIVREGMMTRDMFVLRKGSVHVVKRLKNGQMKQINSMHAGSVFGEISFFHGKGRSSSIIADSFVEILVIQYHQFRELLIEFPHIAEELESTGQLHLESEREQLQNVEQPADGEQRSARRSKSLPSNFRATAISNSQISNDLLGLSHDDIAITDQLLRPRKIFSHNELKDIHINSISESTSGRLLSASSGISDSNRNGRKASLTVDHQELPLRSPAGSVAESVMSGLNANAPAKLRRAALAPVVKSVIWSMRLHKSSSDLIESSQHDVMPSPTQRQNGLISLSGFNNDSQAAETFNTVEAKSMPPVVSKLSVGESFSFGSSVVQTSSDTSMNPPLTTVQKGNEESGEASKKSAREQDSTSAIFSLDEKQSAASNIKLQSHMAHSGQLIDKAVHEAANSSLANTFAQVHVQEDTCELPNFAVDHETSPAMSSQSAEHESKEPIPNEELDPGNLSHDGHEVAACHSQTGELVPTCNVKNVVQSGSSETPAKSANDESASSDSVHTNCLAVVQTIPNDVQHAIATTAQSNQDNFDHVNAGKVGGNEKDPEQKSPLSRTSSGSSVRSFEDDADF